MRSRCKQLRGLAVSLGLGASVLACGGAPAPQPALHPAALGPDALVADVRVKSAASLSAGDTRALDAVAVDQVVRQSALDWLEHRQRFHRDGAIRVTVLLRALRLRSWLVAWVWPDWSGVDSLAADVTVLRGSQVLMRFPARADSSIGGWEWRASGERLDRLARRLGRTIIEAF